MKFVCRRSRGCAPPHHLPLEQGSVSHFRPVQHSGAVTSLLGCRGNIVVDLGWPDQCDLIILRRKQLQQVAELIAVGSLPEWTSSSSCLTFTTFGLLKHLNNSDCAPPWDSQVTYSPYPALCTMDLGLSSTHTLPGVPAGYKLLFTLCQCRGFYWQSVSYNVKCIFYLLCVSKPCFSLSLYSNAAVEIIWETKTNGALI